MIVCVTFNTKSYLKFSLFRFFFLGYVVNEPKIKKKNLQRKLINFNFILAIHLFKLSNYNKKKTNKKVCYLFSNKKQ